MSHQLLSSHLRGVAIVHQHQIRAHSLSKIDAAIPSLQQEFAQIPYVESRGNLYSQGAKRINPVKYYVVENTHVIKKPKKRRDEKKVTLNTGNIEITQVNQSISSSTDNYVSIKLLSGLGNRIFMILAALNYAEKYNKQFVYCIDFVNEGRIAHEKNLTEMTLKIFGNLKVIQSLKSYTLINTSKNVFIYNELPYSPANVVLEGFFQSELNFPSPSLYPSIKTEPISIYFVHIRGGDYLTDYGLNIGLSEYYETCFHYLGNVKYIVFSNDNEYAKKIMNGYTLDYTISNTVNQYDVLVEMANCLGGICANSTFSWMGAFFQGSERKEVFMPSNWWKCNDYQNIYPKWATMVNIRSNKNNDIYFNTVQPESLLLITIIKKETINDLLIFLKSIQTYESQCKFIVYYLDKKTKEQLSIYPSITLLDGSIFIKEYNRIVSNNFMFTRFDAIKYTLHKCPGSRVGYIDIDKSSSNDLMTFMQTNLEEDVVMSKGVLLFRNTFKNLLTLEYTDNDMKKYRTDEKFLKR